MVHDVGRPQASALTLTGPILYSTVQYWTGATSEPFLGLLLRTVLYSLQVFHATTFLGTHKNDDCLSFSFLLIFTVSIGDCGYYYFKYCLSLGKNSFFLL